MKITDKKTLLISFAFILIISHTIHAISLSATLTSSNVILDSGQIETLTAGVSGGTAPYTINFFNVTGNKLALSITYQPWLAENTYPLNIVLQTCTTYTNNIYCMGGYSSDLNYGDTNAIYYAPIFSSGVLGAWTAATNSYPINTDSSSCATYSNNIYCIGGYDTATGVYYAPIFGNGDVGSWVAANSYVPSFVLGQTCLTYSNNIYCVSGYGGGDRVNYAPIFNSGVLGSWITTNGYPFQLYSDTCVLNGNNIYCIGGSQVSGPSLNSVYYAPILNGGGVSSWTSTNSYPDNITGNSCVANSNIIYCTGGYGGYNDGYRNSTYYAPILSSGAVGEWVSTTDYPTKLTQGSCITYDSSIYCIAGAGTEGYTDLTYSLSNLEITNSPTYTFKANSPTQGNIFQYNVIVTDSSSNTANSAINSITVTFPTITLIPSNVNLQNGQIENLSANIVGGLNPYTINFFNITGNSIAFSESTIQQWTNSYNSYPVNVAYHSCVLNSNNIYCIGGSENWPLDGDTNTVYYAPILNNKDVGSWTTTNSYPANTEDLSCTTYKNNIYCIGGYQDGNGDTTNSVYYAPLLNSGGTGSWSVGTNYPTSPDYPSCVTYSNNIYCVAGYDGLGDNNVYYAPILSGNSIGTWTAATSYPVGNGEFSCVTNSNNIYCIGGYPDSGAGNAVYYAPILNDGSLGSWTSINPVNFLSGEFGDDSCVVANSNIICIGGSANTTYYAPILNGGSLGTWSNLTAVYPQQQIGGSSCITNSNYIYCIAGYGKSINLNNTYYLNSSNFGGTDYIFVANSPTVNNNLRYNVIVIDKFGLVANSITNTIIVNYASSSTTTIQNGGGGIIPSGGGGAAASGGASPTVENYTANVTANNNITSNGTTTQVQRIGYILRNFSVDNCKTLNLKEKSINICVSYITNTNTSVIVNNVTYTLTQNTSVEVDPSNDLAYYVKLLNITYVPILHAVNLLVFAQSSYNTKTSSVLSTTILSSTTETSTVLSTITSGSSSVLTTILQNQQSSYQHNLEFAMLAIVIIILVIIGVYHLSTRKRKKKR